MMTKRTRGEIGAGTSVTALYELVPKGEKIVNPGVDELKYSSVRHQTRIIRKRTPDTKTAL